MRYKGFIDVCDLIFVISHIILTILFCRRRGSFFLRPLHSQTQHEMLWPNIKPSFPWRDESILQFYSALKRQ